MGNPNRKADLMWVAVKTIQELLMLKLFRRNESDPA